VKRSAKAAIALFALFVLGEALLFLFNPFSGMGELRGINLSGFGLSVAASLWAILTISPMLALLLLERFSNLREGLFSRRSVYLAVASYFAVFLALSFLRYFSFNSAPPDIWYYNQAMWSTLHGNFMGINIGPFTNYFGIHFAPLLVALVPLYALFQSPLVLLLAQTAFIALGAVPVYWIAMRHLKSSRAAFSFSAAYLLFPALEFINLREFHAVALAIPLILLAWNYFEESRVKPFAFFFALSLLAEETVAPALFFFGLYAIFARRWKWGVPMCIASFSWFLLAIFVFIPFFGNAPYVFLAGGSNNLYAQFGSNPPQIIAGMLSNPLNTISIVLSPVKLGYLAMLLVPVLLLSVFALPVILIAFPVFAQNLLSGYPAQSSIYFHYNSVLIPFLFVSAILGAKRLSESIAGRLSIPRAKEKAILGISLAILVAAVLSNALLSPSPLSALSPVPTQANFSAQKYAFTPHDAIAWKAIGMVPAEARVSADSFFLAQLSGRKFAGYFPETLESADYVLIDSSRTDNPSASTAAKEFSELRSDSNFVRVFAQDGVFLFKRQK